MRFSTVIISLNEAANIAECVTQALKASEEVIVVDAASSDGTAKIAEEHGAKVYVRKWQGYGNAKNFGNDQASNDWILSLDADEILSDEFIRNIREMKFEDHSVYEIDLLTYYFGKALRHSGFYPYWKKRLFNRKHCKWNDNPVHEALECSSGMKVEKLKGKVRHYSFKSKQVYQEKLNQYARLGAEKWMRNGKTPGLLKQYFGPSFRFFKTLVLDLGILDGKAGYEIALMNMRANRVKIKHFKFLKSGK
jgi:(heptosyl)LPS beta-1,4-glucosyltransferase